MLLEEIPKDVGLIFNLLNSIMCKEKQNGLLLGSKGKQ